MAYLRKMMIVAVIFAFAAAPAVAQTHNTPPEVNSVGIVSVTNADDTWDRINIVFSENINASTVNTDTITVIEEGSPDRQITGTVTYDGLQATFKPDASFADLQRPGNNVTVTITDEVRDVDGNALAQDYVQSFAKPAQNTDTTRPTVTSANIMSITNADGTTDYIRIVFSEQMDASTVTTDTITVTETSSNTEISGTVTYDGLQATFKPGAGFDDLQRPGNNFTVTVSDSVSDLAGNPLAQEYVYSFTNPEAAPLVGENNETAPPATASQPGTNWYLVALLILLILALLVMLFTATRDDDADEHGAGTASTIDDFGDVHEIEELEGIGPVYKEKLNDIGIHDSKQLWEANPSIVGAKTGAAPTNVFKWQRMAELASVHGIGPQYAELLERSGVASIMQLSKEDPDELLEKIKAKEDSLNINIQGNTIKIKIVKSWIQEAKEHRLARA